MQAPQPRTLFDAALEDRGAACPTCGRRAEPERLRDTPPAHRGGLDTERTALDPQSLTPLRKAVWTIFQENPGGLTQDEATAIYDSQQAARGWALRGGYSTVKSRFGELEGAGYIVKTDERRRSANGRRAAVWKPAGGAGGVPLPQAA